MADRIGTVIDAVVGVRDASDEGFGFGSNHKDCLARSRYLPIKKAVHLSIITNLKSLMINRLVPRDLFEDFNGLAPANLANSITLREHQPTI